MRFALVGNHPDGLSMTRALTATGRHSLIAYCGPVSSFDRLRESGLSPKGTADLEEVLADPAVEAVIIAGKPGDRSQQLRRALQSERHVLCVHPADPQPDPAYEAAMIQGDTGHVLLPILGDALHPGVIELSRMIREKDGPVGSVRLIMAEHAATVESVLDGDMEGQKPGLPGWDVLRELAGEIVEVSAFAVSEEVVAGQPLLLAARTEAGVLIQASFLDRQQEAGRRFTVLGSRGRAVLTLPACWLGPAQLSWQTDTSRDHRDWPDWEPWPALVEVFEAALERPSASGERKPSVSGGLPPPVREGAIVSSTGGVSAPLAAVCWQDEVRCLELDDAARRSVERRRASTLEYQEASEEIGFKGTMTLLGCALLWSVLLLVILAAWNRRFLFLVIPLLMLFLGLQLFRWLIPARPSRETDENSPSSQ